MDRAQPTIPPLPSAHRQTTLAANWSASRAATRSMFRLDGIFGDRSLLATFTDAASIRRHGTSLGNSCRCSKRCWQKDPALRPTFAEIVDTPNSIKEVVRSSVHHKRRLGRSHSSSSLCVLPRTTS
uniref:Uncharacterized protein n=1 Tax=Zea mays TaxID=4577 RepID=A0A804M229_MAIZE